MKIFCRFCSIVALMIIMQSMPLAAQVKEGTIKVRKPTQLNFFVDIKEIPVYLNGNLNNDIQNVIVYPAKAKKDGVEGIVMVYCIIDAAGNVENVELKRGVHPDLDKEALRVVMQLSPFVAHRENEKKIAARFVIPVKFELP
ncbi:MAG: energy transducer TonB [Bacteroidetes bacterium]|nr:energy transducer TonB [Bacteroidota bacterium]MBU1718988.1 energy transducer TonB [Bacteroidota bacterium]